MLIRELIIGKHEFNRDQSLRKYDVVIIDEAHERTVQSDLLLALLKDICKRKK